MRKVPWLLIGLIVLVVVIWNKAKSVIGVSVPVDKPVPTDNGLAIPTQLDTYIPTRTLLAPEMATSGTQPIPITDIYGVSATGKLTAPQSVQMAELYDGTKYYEI